MSVSYPIKIEIERKESSNVVYNSYYTFDDGLSKREVANKVASFYLDEIGKDENLLITVTDIRDDSHYFYNHKVDNETSK